MKKIALILLAFFVVNTTIAQEKGIKFETGTLAQAMKKVKSNKKGPQMIFLDCYTSWCGPCKMMARDVFTLPEVGEYFNSTFVNIKIDMEKGEGPELAKKYKVTGYPTFLILDGDGKEIARVVGGNYPKPFIKSVQYAIDPTKQPAYLKAQYEEKKTLETGLSYLEVIKKGTKEYNDLLTDIYFSIPDKDKFTPELIDMAFQSFKGVREPILIDLCMKKYVADKYLGSNIVTKRLKDYFALRLGGYCTEIKKSLSRDELMYASMVLGVLAPDPKDLSAHVGNLALLVEAKDKNGIIKYFRGPMGLVPNENKLIIDRVMASIAADPESTKEQKEAVKEYFRLGASTTKSLLESINKRYEEIKL